jgi:hypothetical protein
MTLKVADVRANLNENIRHAAHIIGRSKDRRKVFLAIYRGSKRVKTASEVMKTTGLPRVRVLQEGGKLAGNGIVEKTKVDGETAYKKDETYTHHKAKVLELVDHPEKKAKYPTKQEPRPSAATTYRISIFGSQPRPQEVTIDDIQAFEEVKSHLRPSSSIRLSDLPESRVKRFLKLVVGENYDFQDWGGERNDLFTNKLRFRRGRKSAAFALKGRATSGPLTPKKMGKNGDQIGRLFTSEAQLFFVVYHGKVDQAIHEQMRAYAVARALAGNRVYWSVIDGTDLARLVDAYPEEFKASAKK